MSATLISACEHFYVVVDNQSANILTVSRGALPDKESQTVKPGSQLRNFGTGFEATRFTIQQIGPAGAAAIVAITCGGLSHVVVKPDNSVRCAT